MKKLLTITAMIMTSQAFAMKEIPLEQQIGEIITIETTGTKNRSNQIVDDQPQNPKKDSVEETRKIISITRDMIALGEAWYELVKKGKPSNVTEYAAISVVPRDQNKEYIDPFELEGFSVPVERNFTTKITNGAGKEVVRFDYTVIYSFGGSYRGAGRYLTNVMIVPKNIKTTFGWDFNATMKLNGIMNHGSKEQPVAGAMVAIKYQMSSWSVSFERNDVIHVTGNGELKSYGIK
jgi:hypothetical protein